MQEKITQTSSANSCEKCNKCALKPQLMRELKKLIAWQTALILAHALCWATPNLGQSGEITLPDRGAYFSSSFYVSYTCLG